MKFKQYISILLNSLFILSLLLFLLDAYTSFEIKSQALKSFAYFGTMLLAPSTLLWKLFTFNTRKRKIIASILPAVVLSAILIIGPLKITHSSSAWRTQQVIYQNKQLSFKKIEMQMQDLGAFGYNSRIVEVVYLTKLFMLVSTIDQDIKNSLEWQRVDQEVNELGLKHP